MELKTVLQQNREAVLRKWFGLILESYPSNTAAFLAGQKDQFRNPVGHAISEGIGPIYDYVVEAADPDSVDGALDQIIRIRSIQEFTPSQAVGFVFALKTAVREELNGQVGSADLAEIDARVDAVALRAFDKYAECREQLHEVKNREIIDRSKRLLGRLNQRPSNRQGESTDEV